MANTLSPKQKRARNLAFIKSFMKTHSNLWFAPVEFEEHLLISSQTAITYLENLLGNGFLQRERRPWGRFGRTLLCYKWKETHG